MFIFVIGLIVIAILVYDDYLDWRGRYQYSVLIGIKWEEDSIEDYRFYANNSRTAMQMAVRKYCDENEVPSTDLYVYAVENLNI